jgi:transcriptional regulator of acetoin/glycerol metabolism
LKALDEVMREHILEALRTTNGAAARLGMKRSTRASKMEKPGISRQMQS